MADYVNACSMIAFQNLLDDSLQAIVNKPVEALVVVAILPAIIEEFLFRGMIYRGIANKSNKKMAIIISALLFAFLHMNFNQMCYAFVMGLVFAIVIYLTDNLSVSILLHMLFNAFTVIITCFEKSNAIQAILQCNIAGYTLFNPSLTDTQGKIEISLLIIGGLIAILSAVIAGWLILLIAKTVKTTETTINNENILKDNNKVPKHGSGVGVINVHSRIQLMFGEQYGLEIYSEPDEGTRVVIHIPAIPYTKENAEQLEMQKYTQGRDVDEKE